jgi:hypothetical protein
MLRKAAGWAIGVLVALWVVKNPHTAAQDVHNVWNAGTTLVSSVGGGHG